MLCVFNHKGKNEVLIHATTWIILSERSHTGKATRSHTHLVLQIHQNFEYEGKSQLGFQRGKKRKKTGSQ